MSPEQQRSALASLVSGKKAVNAGQGAGKRQTGGGPGGKHDGGQPGSETPSGGKSSGKKPSGERPSGKKPGKERKAGSKDFFPHSPSARMDSMSVQRDDPAERRYFRSSLILIGGAFLVMLFFFAGAFFLAVRGAERTVVPNIVDKELIAALEMLQERELYPRVQAKFTGNPSDKGLIISQDPEPGLYVKAGRRVTVTVSRGAVMDNVEDYVGMSVTEIRGRLASLFSTFEPLLIIREPVTYVYNDAEPGTVLHQTPEAGTPLSDPRELILIASRGKLNRPVILPDLTDYSAENAMRALARIPLPFIFLEDRSAEPSGYVPRVTSQSPGPEARVGSDRRIVLRFRRPESWAAESVFGVCDFTLPEPPVPAALQVIVREPGAEDRIMFSMPHSGGRLSFPYVLPLGSSVVVELNGEEAERHEVVSR